MCRWRHGRATVRLRGVRTLQRPPPGRPLRRKTANCAGGRPCRSSDRGFGWTPATSNRQSAQRNASNPEGRDGKTRLLSSQKTPSPSRRMDVKCATASSSRHAAPLANPSMTRRRQTAPSASSPGDSFIKINIIKSRLWRARNSWSLGGCRRFRQRLNDRRNKVLAKQTIGTSFPGTGVVFAPETQSIRLSARARGGPRG